MSAGTTDVSLTASGNSLKICVCCNAMTTVLCVNGACPNCHAGGLCHHA